ncbi:cytochrome P450 [Globomyces pollinis-pini]|nr:cytochrome P450 [Globomyces pollinis-pini]
MSELADDMASVMPIQPQTASVQELFEVFIELWNHPDPTIQLALIFFGIFLGIPFIGGCFIIIYNWTKVDGDRPPKAVSYIPFIGVFWEYSREPVEFLRKQFNRRGPVFYVDTIARESLVLTGEDHITDCSHPKQQSTSHLLYMGDQMGSLFNKTYRQKLPSFLKIASEFFQSSQFIEVNRQGLNEFLEARLGSHLGSKSIDLFSISSGIYLNSMIYLFFGKKIAEEFGSDLVDEFHTGQLNLKFSLSRLVASYGIPIGPESQFDKFAKSLEKIASDELERRLEEKSNIVYTDYLQYAIDKKLSKVDRDVFWSHLAHMILSAHANTTASIAFTTYHLARDKKLKKKAFTNPIIMNACLTETSRRYSSISVPRTILGETEMHGYKLTPNSTIFGAPAVTLLDEKLYDSPLEYNPDRWIKKNVETFKKRGKLLTFNGYYFDIPFESFFTQLTQEIAIPLLFAYDVHLNSTNDLFINYWATVCTPWSSCMVSFGTEDDEKKVQ